MNTFVKEQSGRPTQSQVPLDGSPVELCPARHFFYGAMALMEQAVIARQQRIRIEGAAVDAGHQFTAQICGNGPSVAVEAARENRSTDRQDSLRFMARRLAGHADRGLP